jgi:Aldo/keto reductase family
MPMIDVYAPARTFPDSHTLARDLAAAGMRWEQVPDLPLFATNTAAFIHEMDEAAISNVAGDSNYVRVRVLTSRVGAVDRVAGGWLGDRRASQHECRHRGGRTRRARRSVGTSCEAPWQEIEERAPWRTVRSCRCSASASGRCPTDASASTQSVGRSSSATGTSTPPRTRIAQRLGRTPAQVLLRWCIERDVPLIAKSAHRDRIAENAQIFDFTLSNADMAELGALDRTGGTQRALERKWW